MMTAGPVRGAAMKTMTMTTDRDRADGMMTMMMTGRPGRAAVAMMTTMTIGRRDRDAVRPTMTMRMRFPRRRAVGATTTMTNRVRVDDGREAMMDRGRGGERRSVRKAATPSASALSSAGSSGY